MPKARPRGVKQFTLIARFFQPCGRPFGRRTLRLRANLVDAGRIEAAHLRSYAYNPDTRVRDVADFTAEFEAIAGLKALRLFPDDLSRS